MACGDQDQFRDALQRRINQLVANGDFTTAGQLRDIEYHSSVVEGFREMSEENVDRVFPNLPIGDGGYVAESVLARKVTRNDGSVSLIEDVSQRPVPKSLFSEAFKDDSIAPMLTSADIKGDTFVQSCNADLTGGNLLLNKNASWSSSYVPPTFNEDEEVQQLSINGKDYLLIDNSSPEEMDPIKLQAQIVNLEELLRAERECSTEFTWTGGADKKDSASIPYGPYDSCGGYMGLPDIAAGIDFSVSGTCYGTPTVDLGDSLISIDGIKYEVIPASHDEAKLVSSEEANYERAMKGI